MWNTLLPEVRGLLASGDVATASRVAAAALATAEAEFGATHEHSAIAAIALGETDLAQARLGDAILNFERAVDILRTVRPPEHDALSDAFEGLGVAHAARGDTAAAEVGLCNAVEHREFEVGKQHPRVALALERLARFYSEGHFDDASAEPLLHRAVAILRIFPKFHDDWTRVLALYVRVLQRRGAHADADALLEDQIKLERALHGADAPQALPALQQLTISAVARGDFERAEWLFSESTRRLGAHTAPTELSIRYETELADAYRQAGEVSRALAHYRCALVGRRLTREVDDLESAKLATRIDELSRPRAHAFGVG